jgi:hypothetical protein
MSTRADCEQVRALAPELALGITGGDERATALGHLAECAECRRHVEALSTLGDELLLLAPTEEPPVGFETRVLERIHPPAPRRRRRFAPVATAAAAAAAAAAVTAGAMWLGFREDRELASSYRETLAAANGKYFDASKLSAPGGAVVGNVYGYEGSPSWILVTVESARRPRTATYDAQLITNSGDRVPLRSLHVSNGKGSGGEAIPIPLDQVAEVRLLGPRRGQVLDASFPSDHEAEP